MSCRQGDRPGYLSPEQVWCAEITFTFDGLRIQLESSATKHSRAAAHDQLDDLDSVISDCDIAVKLNNKYVKALDRRAKTVRKQAMQASAHISFPIHVSLSKCLFFQVENYVIQVEKLKQCLEDITSVCILEGFQKQVCSKNV